MCPRCIKKCSLGRRAYVGSDVGHLHRLTKFLRLRSPGERQFGIDDVGQTETGRLLAAQDCARDCGAQVSEFEREPDIPAIVAQP